MTLRKKILFYALLFLLTLAALEGMARVAYYWAYAEGYRVPAPPSMAADFNGNNGNGRAEPPEVIVDTQLNEVLNLNLARIKRNREASLHAVAQWYTRTQPDRRRVEREIDRRLAPPILSPYVQVVIWWLERKL